MGKKFLLVSFMTTVFYSHTVEHLYIEDFTIQAAQELLDLCQKHPEQPYIVSIRCNQTLDNGFNHRWWSHLTRHITFSNGLKCLKTITSTAFLACCGAVILIQKTYVSVRKVNAFLTLRSLDEHSEYSYKKIKKYEPLFIAYKSLDKLLMHYNIRRYFLYDIECDQIIDDALAYITLYEQKETKILEEYV